MESDLPRFGFDPGPSASLTLNEFFNMKMRLGKSGPDSCFGQSECEFGKNAPQAVKALTAEKMKEAQRRLGCYSMAMRSSSGRLPRAEHEPGEYKSLFFCFDLIRLVMYPERSEDCVGHSLLVSRYVLLLTHSLGINDREFVHQMVRGAVLHDIGKIGVPRHILGKKGPLTQSEKMAVRLHPLLGYELAREFDFLEKPARIILFHHEKYDGSGYPFGLRKNEIPLEARIFAVADAVDAITSDRDYSRARSLTEAEREVKKGKGKHFDPDVVDAFLSVPLEEWRRVRLNSRWPRLSQIVH